MPKFSIEVHTKVSIWVAESFEVEAASEVEVRQMFKSGPPEGMVNTPDFKGSEYLFDTENPVSIDQNKGQPIYEIHTCEEVQEEHDDADEV